MKKKLARLLKELEAAPFDRELLLQLAQSYRKLGDDAQAARFVARAAKVEERDGFFLKAIAFGKQALRLDPAMSELHEWLAELHLRIGLKEEAGAYLAAAGKAYVRAGQRDHAHRVHAMLEELGLAVPKARA